MRPELTLSNPAMDPPIIDSDEPISSALLSHDIRSALTQIVHAGKALEGLGLTEPQLALVSQIGAAAMYINDLLGTGSGEADTVPVSQLAPLITELETLWTPEAEKNGLTFLVERVGVLPNALRFSKIDLLRIFNNIIGNAMKFTKRGALTLRFVREQSGALIIELDDDGRGFTEGALQKLFSKHGRPENETAEGSGLGLFIARGLIDKAGGDIRVENRPSGGARVAVSFPEDLLMAAEKRAAKPMKGMPDLSHLNILLAEDNPTNQLVATQMLKKMGARVETAADGVAAMTAFENGAFDLGLIDIEMPRKSGLEVMRDIRARGDAKAKTTLLALTAYVLPEHKDRIMASGADGIIAKPLTDIAAFGQAILMGTGAPEGPPADASAANNPDAEIQMDVYSGLKGIIGKDSMLELLGKVQSDLGEVRSGVLEGVANKDVGPIRASTHILISVAGAFGAVNLQHIAEALNATAKTGDWTRIEPEADRCAQGISDVLQFVTSELKGE